MAAITAGGAPLLLVDRMRKRATPAQWLAVAWLGVGDALNVYFVFQAYAHTSVAVAVTTHYLAPILVAGASPFLLRERARPRTWFAVVLAFVGLLVMLRPWSALSTRDLTGAAFGFGSALFYASNVLVNKRLVGTFSATELMVYHGVVATPALALLAPSGSFGAVTLPSALVLVFGGLFPGALGGLLFIWALRRIPASHAMTLTLLEPLTAFLVGLAALRQSIHPLSVAGGAIILTSTFLVMTDPTKPTPG